MRVVESEVQLENVDARLAEQAEVAACDVLLDELADLRFAEAARLGDARRLKIRVVGRDVGIEPEPEVVTSIDRHGLARDSRGQLVDVALNALHELGIRLREVRTAGRRRRRIRCPRPRDGDGSSDRR